MADKKSVINALNEALKEEMRRDEDVYIIGEDVAKMGGSWQITAGLLDEFGPDRAVDTPINEMSIVSMAVGEAALMGRRPVIEVMFADMLPYCYDSIINQAAKIHSWSGGDLKCPMVIRCAQGAGGGIGCHHSQSGEGWFMNVPGLKIISPSNPYDAKGLMKAAIRDDNPVLFFEHKALYHAMGDYPDDDFVVPIGKARRIKEGTDITIIASQLMLGFTQRVLPEIEKAGVNAEIIDPRTIKPFDEEMICESAAKTGKVLIIHENPKFGGPGAEMASVINEQCFGKLKKPIERLCGKEMVIPYGPSEWFCFPNAQEIAETAIKVAKE
ncbi:alpha-ketoacid dehydrogenase subunit beta [Pseudoramibacter alactolyticus]|uniref:alpha-ketoacid dehydrogenase subunit beta n=1 Tax=Pseudoramibacter alactolyticus TaxID=113287 RepID=UPI0023565450|nr:alpha-ketoacid dehydrogenase subunit beta [Pseudoramibacter alactolyticus]MBM6968821.1 alpha-ketoacid dehydrogenase subunit beta [Pseudoramibacter alactolyticus]